MSETEETVKREWKDARNHREPKWPLMGYAPGKYVGTCSRCHERLWDVDKRAWNCLPCAVDAANEALEQHRRDLAQLKQENETLRAAIKIVAPLLAPSEAQKEEAR